MTSRSGRRQELSWPTAVGEQLVLTRERLGTLRKTTLGAIGVLRWHLPVTATCAVAHPVDVDLSLFAFQVDAPDFESVPGPLVAAAPEERQPPAGAAAGAPVRGGARAEILAVINDLVARSGRPEVTLVQLVAEMRGRGSEYAESTVRTMVSSHMCAQVHGPNIGSYDDLDRVGARPALPSTNLLSSRQATRQRSRLLPTYPSIVEKQSKPGLDDSLPLL